MIKYSKLAKLGFRQTVRGRPQMSGYRLIECEEIKSVFTIEQLWNMIKFTFNADVYREFQRVQDQLKASLL